MIIAIASGKGGTGKTTLAVNLSRIVTGPIRLLDCDVEAPNAHLFLPGPISTTQDISVPVPQVDEARCDACGVCSRFCQFQAIAVLRKAMVFSELCHSCGGCARICPQGALTEIQRCIGVIEVRQYRNINLLQGRLDIGVAMAPPLIRAVQAQGQKAAPMPIIIDAPPGTSCPVVAAIKGADCVILVTEPTPFGLHDLKLAVAMMSHLKLPYAVVVNRAGIGDDRVHQFCRQQNIPILLEIPDDRSLAEAYSRGELVVDSSGEYRELFVRLWQQAVILAQGAES